MRPAVSGHAPRASGYDPVRKILTVLRGLRHGVLTDFSVSYKLIVSLLIMGTSIWLRQWIDVAIVAVVTAQALTAELFNTAIEDLCDFVEPGHHASIGAIKDVAAAAAGLAVAVWVGVVGWEYVKVARLLL